MNAVNRLVSLNIIQLAIFPMECGKCRSKLDIVKIHSSSVSPRLVATPVLLYAGLEGSLCLSYIYIATTARYLVHNSRLLLQWVLVLDFCQLSTEGGCRLEDCSDVISSAYSSHIFT